MFKIKVYGPPSNKKFAFIFSGIGLPLWQLSLPGLPIWSLRRAGYSVIAYQYSTKAIYKAESYKEILIRSYEDAQKRLNQLTKYSEIVTIGISFGSLAATRLAIFNRRVKKLILNVPYADPLVNLADYIPTRKYSEAYARRFKDTLNNHDEFKQLISQYSPLQLAGKAQNLYVMLFIARKDKFFLYKYAKKLRDKFRKNAKSFICFETNKGHYWGATHYNIQSWRWLSWLNSKY